LKYPHSYELVEEVKWYHLDIVGISSTKKYGSGTVNLDSPVP